MELLGAVQWPDDVPTATDAVSRPSLPVLGISDGGPLKARCDDQTLSIRLAEIDAPETGQSSSIRSRQSLAALCFRKAAQLRPVSFDRYSRTAAHVECNRIDAGTSQVMAGMAWVFVRYALVGSDLYRLEREARAGRLGLWSDPHAVAPWIWREQKRSVASRRRKIHSLPAGKDCLWLQQTSLANREIRTGEQRK